MTRILTIGARVLVSPSGEDGIGSSLEYSIQHTLVSSGLPTGPSRRSSSQPIRSATAAIETRLVQPVCRGRHPCYSSAAKAALALSRPSCCLFSLPSLSPRLDAANQRSGSLRRQCGSLCWHPDLLLSRLKRGSHAVWHAVELAPVTASLGAGLPTQACFRLS